MLDETLVVFCSEFGRTQVAKKDQKGREHHPLAFSSWLAGGGTAGGTVYGASDEMGRHPARDKVHLHDFHATIMHLMGFDHEKLTYRYAGRDFRLTDVHGHVVRGLLARSPLQGRMAASTMAAWALPIPIMI